MGYGTQSNQSLLTSAVNRLLNLIRKEAETEISQIAMEYWKVGAAIALAVCSSLHGPEVLFLDLAGLRNHFKKGKYGVLPNHPLRTGTDLTGAPYVFIVLIGIFKGESGVHHHMLNLASTSSSGITLRWWLEKLIQV